MNYTNPTTDKPVNEQTNASSTFGSARDIAILQLVTTLFALIYVHYIIRKKDKKDEKERLEKEERDKIADIINNEYNKIVKKGIIDKLRKCKTRFQNMVMFYGSVWETRGRKLYTITGLDVLRYQLLNPPESSEGKPLKTNLEKDLDAVVRLFQSLRIKLPLKGDCPVNIKEELGPLIADVGEIARSFVSARKRYTISNVLKYFGNVREVRSKRNEEMEDKNDKRKIERIIPYINNLECRETSVEISALTLALFESEDFNFSITFLVNPERNTIIQELKYIICELCNIKKTIQVEDLRSFSQNIDSIWRRNFQQKVDIPMPDWGSEEHLRANIIHAVRIFMFKLVEGSDFIHDVEFKELIGEMENIIFVQDRDLQERRSDRAIRALKRAIDSLWSDERAYLCEKKCIADALERVSNDIHNSIDQALRNQPT